MADAGDKRYQLCDAKNNEFKVTIIDVLDRTVPRLIARCYEEKDAIMICELLNRAHEGPKVEM